MSERKALVGRGGELRVAARLLEMGWNVATPLVDDEGIDLIAFRAGKYVPIQVKTATLTRDYAYTIRRKTIRKDTDLVLAFGDSFLVMSYAEWEEKMGSKLETASWQERGSYTDHIHRDLRGWTQFLDNDFQRLGRSSTL